MGWLDDDDDLPARPAPLPPEDRLWRHPSEMAAARAAAVPVAPVPRLGRERHLPRATWWTVAGAFALGIIVTGSGLAATGRLGTGEPPTTVVEKVEAAAAPAGPTGRAREVLASTVRIVAAGDGADRVGSGVVFRDDGHVLTTAELVGQAPMLTATLPTGEQVVAEVVGTDPATDLAVVRIDAGDTPAVVLGSAHDLQVGERVVAVGAALGPSSAAVAAEGVVQATAVRLDTDDGSLYDLVLATAEPAPALPAGSVLVDQAGAVVGLVTTLDGEPSPDPGRSGAWATPIEYARRIAGQLIEHGEAQHAWLGTATTDAGHGAAVREVSAASPASAGGLEPGDVLTSIDGRAVSNPDDVALALRDRMPGDRVRVTYLRDGQAHEMDVVLAARPEPPTT